MPNCCSAAYATLVLPLLNRSFIFGFFPFCFSMSLHPGFQHEYLSSLYASKLDVWDCQGISPSFYPLRCWMSVFLYYCEKYLRYKHAGQFASIKWLCQGALVPPAFLPIQQYGRLMYIHSFVRILFVYIDTVIKTVHQWLLGTRHSLAATLTDGTNRLCTPEMCAWVAPSV